MIFGKILRLLNFTEENWLLKKILVFLKITCTKWTMPTMTAPQIMVTQRCLEAAVVYSIAKLTALIRHSFLPAIYFSSARARAPRTYWQAIKIQEEWSCAGGYNMPRLIIVIRARRTLRIWSVRGCQPLYGRHFTHKGNGKATISFATCPQKPGTKLFVKRMMSIS